MSDVHIVGAGIHPFGRHAARGPELGAHAVREALADAGLEWGQMQFAFGGSWESRGGEAVLSELGATGLPFVNVANGCATGATALMAACWAVASGACELGIVLGFDAHPRGAFNFDPALFALPAWYGETGLMLTTQFFAMKIRRYMHLHRISEHALALVAQKAFENGARAPHAWRRSPIALDQILNAPMVSDPLTKYMFCSPSEGGAALVVASARKMRALGLAGPRVRAVALRSREEGSFEVFAPSLDIKRSLAPTQLASKAAYEMAGLGPADMNVAQLQDTESGAEIRYVVLSFGLLHASVV